MQRKQNYASQKLGAWEKLPPFMQKFVILGFRSTQLGDKEFHQKLEEVRGAMLSIAKVGAVQNSDDEVKQFGVDSAKGKKPQRAEEEKKPETKEAWGDAGDAVAEAVEEALG
ncbi:AZG1 [Symbiodinium microadriaticum]|nr:AZG1 [Symbiodinium microadriaticum]